MTSNLLSLGTQAVKTNQSALAVVGQNISNVNTDGYNRQVVHLNSTVPNGVRLESIERVTDDFLSRQLWSDTSNYKHSEIFADMALEVDNLLGQEVTSITKALDSYFASMQNAVDDPTAIAHRELLLAQSETLTDRFNNLFNNVHQQHAKVNSRLDDAAAQINTYATSIAELNKAISMAELSNNSANELLDQRDRAIQELSEMVDIAVVEGKNSSLSVSLANGQPLVVGMDANPVYTAHNDLDGTERVLGIDIAGTRTLISSQISGGTVGGLLDYRNEVLNPTLNELGRIAIAFSMSMNEVQQSGMDLNNDLGARLFSDPNAYKSMQDRISGSTENTGKMRSALVEITDLSKLSADEYELEFATKSELTIRNLTNGEVTTLDNLQSVTSAAQVTDGTYYADFNAGKLTLEMDGLKIHLDAVDTFRPGDKFQLQPTRRGAEEVRVEMTDARKLAFASPVRANTGGDNSGTGEISVKVTDINASSFSANKKALTPPVQIVFSGSGDSLTYTAFDMTDPAKPVPLDIGLGPIKDQPFAAGEAIKLGGYEATIINEPKAGDVFSFEYNKDGFSDNRNALTMSNLQQADLLDSGSYQDSYSGLLERVAGTTARAKIHTESNSAVLTATTEARASLSGVNMDEEAARLVQFQQAYQASAQIISASQKLFDTLLNL